MAETVRRLKINRRYESSACSWCGDALLLGEDGAICEACESPHHARCWDKANGCNGDVACVNRPLQQLPEQPQPSSETKRRLSTNESICASCGDIVTGFCFRCRLLPSGEEYTGPTETAQDAKDALKYAIIGLFCFGFVLGPIAISKAIQAKRQIAIDPRLGGRGIATAAMVLGVVEILLFIFYVFGALAVGR